MTKLKIIVLLSSIAIFFLFLHFLTLNYETNDDPLMLLISSGALTGSPDEHLQCINIIIGYILKGLYTAMPGMNWYSLFLLTVHFCSLILIVTATIYNRNATRFQWAAFIMILFLGYEALFLVKLQFTATAFVCGFAAIYCIFSVFKKKYKLTLFLVFFILAFLIRKEVFLPLMIFAAIAFTLSWWNKDLQLSQVILTLIVTSIICFFAQWMNDHDKDYLERGYYAHHKATDIICNNPIDTTNNKITKYGWSENDMKMFDLWFWADEQQFPKDKVIAFSKEVDVSRTVIATAWQFYSFLLGERFAIIILLISAVSAILITDSNKIKAIVVLNVAAAFAMILYLVVTTRVPTRVSTPILFYVAIVNIFLLLQVSKSKLKNAVLLLFTLMCVYKFWCVYEYSNENKKYKYLFEQAVTDVNNNPDDLFVIVLKGFPMERIPVFYNTAHLVKNKNLVFGGWFINMPAYDEILRSNKLNNLGQDIIGRKNIVFVCYHKEFPGAVTNYYKEHYGVTVRFEDYEKKLNYLYAKRIRF